MAFFEQPCYNHVPASTVNPLNTISQNLNTQPENQISYRILDYNVEYSNAMLPFKEEQASKYIIELFKSKLPKELTFHNLSHTKDVVKAVRLIGHRSGISREEDQLLRVAAWFHDSGYIKGYANHEAESIAIAETFLAQQLCSKAQIDQIKDLIAATRVPQRPQNLLSCIICDADLFHLSKRNYKKYERRLRKEWELCLGEILR
jgi:predicted metal-dependent HD superfamily phosphohydrolase